MPLWALRRLRARRTEHEYHDTHKKTASKMAGLLAKIALACVIAGSAADSAAKPHILMILADAFG